MSIRFVDYPEEEVKHGLYEPGTTFTFGKIIVIDTPLQLVSVRTA